MKSLGSIAGIVEGEVVLRCAVLMGSLVGWCAMTLGCASAEKPPLVVVAAPPAPSASTPRSTAAPSATTSTSPNASADTNTPDSERLEQPLWRSTATPTSTHDEPASESAAIPPDLGALDRELRGLELLQQAGEGRCSGSPDTEQHSECVLAEMERMVTELAPACAKKSGQAQHQCIIDEVFRELGP